ncbi:MAG: fibronectin type III domain-containing protein [Candidatus Brocadiia bacterium]
MNNKIPRLSIWIILCLLFPLISGCILFWTLPIAMSGSGSSGGSDSPTGSSGGLKTVTGIIYETIYGSVKIAPSGGVQITFVKDGTTYNATTASDGSFSITGVPEGIGQMTASKNGYTSNDFTVNTSVAANLSRSITKRNTNHVFISAGGGAINTFSETTYPRCQVTVPAGAVTADTEMELTPYITVSDLPGNFPAGVLPLAGANLSSGSVYQFNGGNKADAYTILPSSMRPENLTGATIKLMEYISGQWVEASGDGEYISAGLWAGYLGPKTSSPAKISGCYPWCYVVKFANTSLTNYAYVRGKVSDISGAALEKILVVGYGAAATTDISGNYNLGPLTVVNATDNTLIPVTAYLNGYLPNNQFISLKTGDIKENIDFTLRTIDQVAILGGLVTDSINGTALNGVQVSYKRSPAIKTLSYDNRGTTSDISDDTFTVIPSTGVNPSAYQWVVTKNSVPYTSTLYTGASVNINNIVTEAQSQGMTVDVGAYRIGCNVTLASGTVSVDGGFQIALVGMLPAITDIQLPIMVEFGAEVLATTNANGGYLFFDVPYGEPLTVTAKATGYNTSETSMAPISTNFNTKDFSLVPTTGDFTPPSVIAVSPADNAQDVAINSSIQITFSEAMNNSTINTSSFRVTGSSGDIGGQVSYNSGNYTATFSPSAQLAYNTTHTVTLSIAARDLYDNAITGTYSSTFRTVSDLPNTPSSFTATALSYSQIRLAWQDTSTNETGFEIESSPDGATWSSLYLAPPNTTIYVNSSLTASTTYYYRIKAFNLSGNSNYSSSVSATTFAIPTIPPNAPTGLSATAVSSAKVNLSWTDASTDEEGFYIERKVAGGTYARIATLMPNIVIYSDTTGLSATTTYYYRLQSFSVAGNSSYCTEKSVVTPAPAPTAPVAPSGLAAVGVSSAQIDLSWTDNSDNENGFRVQRKQGVGGTYSTIASSLAQNTTIYHNSGLNSNTEYYYRVQAYNAYGYSAWSTEANGTTAPPADTPPIIPSDLTATAISAAQITLQWSDNSTNEDGFKIYYNNTGISPFSYYGGEASANTTSYTVSGLNSDTTHYFIINSYNAAGDSPESNSASAKTWPPVPSAPSPNTPYNAAENISLKPTFIWSQSGTVSSYRLQVSSNSEFSAIVADTGGITNTTYTLTTALANQNTVYYWRVNATNVSGTGPWSSAYSFKTVSAPSVPTGPNASASATNQINLYWSYNGSAAEGYYVYRCTDGVSFIPVATSTYTSFVDTGLTSYTTYYYKFTAYNSAGESVRSSSTSATTWPPLPAMPTPDLPADAAINISINPTISWSAVTYAQSYHLQVAKDSIFSAGNMVYDNQYVYSNSQNIYSLIQSTAYYWRVSARNQSGDTDWPATPRSFTTTDVPNAAPSALSVTAVSSSRINFSWTDNSNNEDIFDILYSTDNSYFYSLPTAPANAITYSLTSAYYNTLYYFKVRAVNSVGYSNYSNTASDTTWLPVPEPTNIYSPSSSAINVSLDTYLYWNSVWSATSYKLQVATDTGFAYIVRDFSGIATNYFSITPSLNSNTVYYCRVKAVNISGESAWSTNTYYFTTALFQPDLAVSEDNISYLGDNIFNYTGLSQTLNDSVDSGNTVKYYFQIKNESNLDDYFTFAGTSGNAQWTITYYNEYNDDITTNVVNGTYNRYFNANGTQYYSADVTLITDTAVIPLNLFFTGTSWFDIACKDTVKIVADMTKWQSVAAGIQHNIAIKNDGSLWAWGDNSSGQLGLGDSNPRWGPVQVGADKDWSQVSAGNGFSMAVKTNGTLWTWGYNWNGQLGQGDSGNGTNRLVPTQVGSDTDWSKVAAGGYHAMALKTNGTLLTWGWNNYGQLGFGYTGGSSILIPTVVTAVGTAWSYISAGIYHSIASNSDTNTYTWGYNGYGQLGHGDYALRNSPVALTTSGWSVVKAGSFHTVGIISGQLWVWGWNLNGQLGLNDTNNRNYPCRYVSATSWVAVAGGYYHTLARNSLGTIYAAGDNASGQLGLGESVSYTWKFLAITTTLGAQLAAGRDHSFTIRSDGTLYSWGWNQYGQLGHGDTKNRFWPTKVYLQWLMVSGGYGHTIGLKSDGTLWSWGYGYDGQLGHGDTSYKYTPTQISTGTDWSFVDCGDYYSLGVKTNGTLWSWGDNWYGQLGQGTSGSGTNKYSPTQVGLNTNWASVSAGNYHSLAVTNGGQLWSWGYNAMGQLGLGIGDYTNRTVPTYVTSLGTVTLISAGTYHSACVAAGILYTFGYNYYGALGTGDLTDHNHPDPQPIRSGIISVSAGYQHTVITDGQGKLWSTGYNSDYGQLGTGNNTNTNYLVQEVTLATDWVSAVAGNNHTMAVKTNGTIYAWGAGSYGQLGQGIDWANWNNPRLVGSDTDWSKIGAGSFHSLGVKRNNSLWGWGYNNSYQLGLNNTDNKNTPTKIK